MCLTELVIILLLPILQYGYDDTTNTLLNLQSKVSLIKARNLPRISKLFLKI